MVTIIVCVFISPTIVVIGRGSAASVTAIDPATGSLPALRILLVPFRRHFLSSADRRKPSSHLQQQPADVAGCCFMDVLSVVSRDVWPTGGTTGFAITAVVLSMAFGVKESPSSVSRLHYLAEEGSDS